MATIRQWLTDAGFKWNSGRIILQEVGEDEYCPGWGNPESAREATPSDRKLDYEFESGFGAPRCPRFIAEDDEFIYFPSQYDGATSLVVVFRDISKYLNPDNPTPYPGG